jgi:TonB family protein
MKVMLAGAAIAATLLVGAASAEPKPAKASSVWARTPSLEQGMALLPEASRRESAFAAMRCIVGADQGLTDCRVMVENPAGLGLGKALLTLAPQYRVKTAAEGGLAPGSEVIEPFNNLRFDTPPDWVRKPRQEDLLAVWPAKALASGIGGNGTIVCLVSTQGALFDCFVKSETPAGENFGAAAIALTPQFLMKPASLKGTPVISVVTIPVNFVGVGAGQAASTFGSRKMVDAVMAWPEAPSYAAVAAAYPKEARAKKLGGRATLSCEFNAEGRLARCNTLTEEPHGLGFASAAKQLTKEFRAFPNTSSGASLYGARVQLAIVFDPAMLADGKPVIGKAQWAGLPSAEDTRAAFSRVETGHGTVRVLLACVVQPGGGVSGCTVEREEPAGIGVGQAALALAPRFRLSTWSAEGLPVVGGTVNIPLRYEGGAVSPAASASPPPASARPGGPG